MTPFRRRLQECGGDLRWLFWSASLIAKRLARGQNSAGRRLYKVKVGKVLF